MAEVTSTEQKRRFVVIVGGIALTVAVLFLVVLFFISPTETTPVTSVKTFQSNAVADKSVVAGEGSEEYNKNLAAYDDKRADAALEGGKSFIPTPVINPKPLVSKRQEPPAPIVVAPPPAAPAPQPVVRQAPPVNNELRKRTYEDMALLDGQLRARRGTGKIEYVAEAPPTKPADGSSSGSSGSGGSSAQTKTSPVKSGDILYAVVDTGINSDVQSTAMATIVAGKLKNYKLLGGFQRFDERLVVGFNRLISPTGEEYTIDGYAIDPATTEASVASRVNTRFFERWGGLVAASFLEGLGEAKRYSGANSYSNNGYGNMVDQSDQMAWGDYSVSDQMWIAAGKVGQRAGRIMERNFERPPTVYLDSGSEIGILIVNGKK